MSENTIHIIGHKNPDTDAICSAIAYEALKHALGQTQYKAARCGNSNSRIDTILNRFEVSLPPMIGDVTPRARDIMQRDVCSIHKDATCAEALDIIEKHDVRALPVLDDDQKLHGLISIFHLGEFFIPQPHKQREIRHVRGSLQSIVNSLDARTINMVDANRDEDLYVRIGAMDIRTFGKFVEVERISADQNVIIVGNREDIQQKAIKMGVRLIIITGNQEVDEEVYHMAKEHGVSLIVSPFDSATTAWVSRTATRLRPMIHHEVMTFQPETTLANIRKRISQERAMAYMVIDDEERLIGVFSNSDIVKPPSRNLVLVDHNELSQAVNGADQVNIVEIIDHHRLGNPSSHQPILFYNMPLGSTCTIIALLHQQNGITPSPAIAGLMMSGIISDTLKLRSPTTTDRDRELLEWLENISPMDSDKLAELIFTSGSLIVNSTPEKVVESDCKIYEEGHNRYSISQIEELGYDNFWDKHEILYESLEKYRQENQLDFSCLFVTDVRSQNSLLVISGPDALLEAMSYPHIEEDYIFEMPGIVSRKKQLIPYVSEMLGRVELNT